MMGDGRDLQGGEDQDQGSQGIMGGKSADVGSIWVEKLKDGEDKQNMSVSEMSLMCIWLEKKMSKEVLRENFEAAASIKGEIIKIHNKSLLMLEKKILSAASDMRNEIANQRKDSLKSIEMDYERAVAEDDFETWVPTPLSTRLSRCCDSHASDGKAPTRPAQLAPQASPA